MGTALNTAGWLGDRQNLGPSRYRTTVDSTGHDTTRPATPLRELARLSAPALATPPHPRRPVTFVTSPVTNRRWPTPLRAVQFLDRLPPPFAPGHVPATVGVPVGEARWTVRT